MNLVRDYKPNKGLGYRRARKRGSLDAANQYTGNWKEHVDGSSDYYQEPVSGRAKLIVNLVLSLLVIAAIVWFLGPYIVEAIQWSK